MALKSIENLNKMTEAFRRVIKGFEHEHRHSLETILYILQQEDEQQAIKYAREKLKKLREKQDRSPGP